MNNYDNANDFLKTIDGNICDICEMYYTGYLEDESSQEDAISKLVLLFNWDGETDKSIVATSAYTADEYTEKIKSVKPVINTILDNLIKEKLLESDFYLKLWEILSQKTIFPDRFDIVCAIICLITSRKIPYFALEEGVRMDNEEFSRISKSTIDEFKKVLFVFNVGYTQKTEVASQLLKIIHSFTDIKEQTVILSNILSVYENKIIKLRKELDKAKNISEE